MLSLSAGHDTAYLTNAVAAGRENYYTGAVAAGEPAGRWWGAAAEQLDLVGEVDAEVMTAVYKRLQDPRDERETLGAAHKAYRTAEEIYEGLLEKAPAAGPEQRARMRATAESRARQAVAFIDATFSAPKSVTVLAVAAERAENDARTAGDERVAAGWAAHRRAIEAAVMAGATASVAYLQDVAGYARTGHHGGARGRWVDAHQWVVGQFLQHDSRARDPQLHVHQAILNRQLSADGKWRALDGKALYQHRGAAGAIGERVMEAHLAATLGVRFEARPDGHGREVVGVPQAVMELFSARTRTITPRLRERLEAFAARFGREASPLERARINKQITLGTRAAKRHDGETEAQRLDRWEREARQVLAGGLAQVAHGVLTERATAPAATWNEDDVLDRALARVGDARQTWTRSDLTRAISDELPGGLGVAPADVRALLDGLTDRALARATPIDAGPDREVPRELQLEDGRAADVRPGSSRWTTPGQMVAEQMLRAAAVTRVDARCTAAQADEVLGRIEAAGVTLGADQAAALAGVLSSGAQLQVMSAPAGSGKSFVVGQAASAWAEHGGRVLGLAPSQIAANVLKDEGVEALNLAAWKGAVARGDAPAADLLVVDEAGMARTEDLVAVVEHAQRTGATVLLVGDPRQLAAVGPGGALGDVAEHGIRHELTSVRRFREKWEGQASLQLRDGDPAAIEAYHRHGRLVDGGTTEQAEAAAGRAWLADTVAGRESLLVVGSNESAARLSGQMRQQLVELGRVQETGVPLGRDENTAGVGDLVQARRNDWSISAQPINRAVYRVVEVLGDGGLRVEPSGGGEAVTLPASYVAADLTLAYASTVHAAQGRTVDTAHAVVGGAGAAAAYVALTRGRDRNTAYAVTRPLAQDTKTGQTFEVEPTTARAVMEGLLERAEPDLSALQQREAAEEFERNAGTLLERLAEGAAMATAGRTARILDDLTADGVLTGEQREQLAADQATGSLDRLLRTVELAGHDPAEVLRGAAEARGLAGSTSLAQVLHYRIRESDLDLAPKVTSARDLVPSCGSEEMTGYLQRLADRFDERRHELGEQAGNDIPAWVATSLGPPPQDPLERAEWEMRAGWAAAHREAADVDDTDDRVLGAAPPAGLAEQHAVWRTAHAELDLPEAGADEAVMSDGQLRGRVAAAEREAVWAPRFVDDDLAATEQALAERRADVELWSARADAGDPDAEDLRAAAARAEREALQLADQLAQLTEIDDARARWYAETAVTRDLAERARVELTSRGVDVDGGERVTAEEWLAAHHAEQLVEDQHREITEADLRIDEDTSQFSTANEAAETAVPDIRDVAVPDPTEHADRREPMTLDETAAAVERAREALAEIEAREAMEPDLRPRPHDPVDTETDSDGLTMTRTL